MFYIYEEQKADNSHAACLSDWGAERSSLAPQCLLCAVPVQGACVGESRVRIPLAVCVGAVTVAVLQRRGRRGVGWE